MVKVNLPIHVIEIIKKFEEANFEIYIVGGVVRDILMEKESYDWDFTTNATPEEMLRLFNDAYYTNKFGTVGIPSEEEGERPYEITTFRTEHGYSDSRRPDRVEWGTSLKEDLQRRDFTINSLALKITNTSNQITNKLQITKINRQKKEEIQVDVEIIDLYEGKIDLKNKLIRAVGDPHERFSEDALRMLRAVRIATEIGFSIEEKTFEAIKSNATLINRISRERVRDELLKIFKSNSPYDGIISLKHTGLLDEILPELSKTFGVEQKSPGRHHIYDVGTHSLMALKFVSVRNNNPIVRFATLIHDIGKPLTYKKLASGTITFYNHELFSAKIAKRIAERLHFSNDQTEKFYKLVRYHQFTVDEKQTDSAIRRFIKNVGKENIDDMIDLRIGDRLGGGARETSWRLEDFKKRLIEVQKQPFSIKDLKINGYDIMKILNLPSGPEIGQLLQKLFVEVTENNLPNEKEILMNKVKEI